MSDMSKFPVRVAIARAIRDARIKKRMSQFALAMTSCISPSSLKEIEDGKRPVEMAELQRLQRGLGEDGAKLFRKAFRRRVRRDPKLRAFAIEALSMVMTDAEKGFRDGDEELDDSSSGKLQ